MRADPWVGFGYGKTRSKPDLLPFLVSGFVGVQEYTLGSIQLVFKVRPIDALTRFYVIDSADACTPPKVFSSSSVILDSFSSNSSSSGLTTPMLSKKTNLFYIFKGDGSLIPKERKKYR